MIAPTTQLIAAAAIKIVREDFLPFIQDILNTPSSEKTPKSLIINLGYDQNFRLTSLVLI